MRALLVALLASITLVAGAASAAAAPRSCGTLEVKVRNHDVGVYTARTRCATALRLARAWVRRDGCRDCKVRGWTCRGLRESTLTRCKLPGHPRRVVQLDEVISGAGETFATAATAIKGGIYNGTVASPCDSACVVRFVVVDDGRSLASRSIVAAPCDFAETPTADSQAAPRGTPIRRDGSFRWRTRYQVVEGQFTADGRFVTGFTRFLGRAREDCSAVEIGFRAELKRRAKSKGTCESLDKGRLEVSVFVRRTGCTEATRVVDAWRVDRDCISTSLARSSCRVAGRRCTPVLGGRLKGLAGVACVAGRSRIELVLRQSCGGPGPAFGYETTAINLSCSEATQVTSAWKSGCGERRSCTVAGWRCTRPKGKGPLRQCRRGHLGVDIWRQVLVFD